MQKWSQLKQSKGKCAGRSLYISINVSST